MSEALLAALGITVPLFALVGVGAVAHRLGWLGPAAADALSAYVFWLAFPALLFTALSRAPALDANGVVRIGLHTGLLITGMGLALLVSLLLRFQPEARAVAPIAVGIGNTSFLGLPLVSLAYGEPGLLLAAGLIAIENVVIMALGLLWLFWGKRDAVETIRHVARNPILLGALLGFAVSIVGVRVPVGLNQTLTYLGESASPVALVALGVALSGNLQKQKRLTARGETSALPIAVITVLKILALPLIVLAGYSAAGMAHFPTAVAVTLAATPTAASVFIQTRQAEVFADGTALIVLFTTLASMIGISLILSQTLGLSPA